ncbi:MAG: PKD domain-containing protein, partial [Fibrobacter sp.]|nr:PKD domain-containing protein [Fibrobacter sp.]
IIRYKSSRVCSLNIIIRAINSDSVSSDYEYVLNVSSTPQASLRVPSVVVKDEKFNIMASLLISDDKPTLIYRYDFNGDRRFDYSETVQAGKSSVIKDFSFPELGYHTVFVEITDSKTNKKYSKLRRILVNEPPKVTFKITPESGNLGTKFTLLVNCNGACDSVNQMIMQLDMSRDGKWEQIQGGTLLESKQFPYQWKKPGTYQLRLIVSNKIDVSDTLFREVVVNQVIQVKSISSVDTANVGDTVRFTCNMDSSSAPVKYYEWSFEESSVFATTTQNNISRVFSNEGKYVVSCRVVDQNGTVTLIQKEIVVRKSVVKIGAGGPYKADINKEFGVEEKISDPDKRIIRYSWDFDGDNKPEWTSDSSSKARHVFRRSGKYVIRLSAELKNGEIVRDSSTVTVVNSKPIAKAGEDILSKSGRNVKLEGIGEDKDSNIVRYEWDFDGDGKADWSSAENGIVKHEFEVYSNAVFTVIDSDSAKVSDTIRIIICPEGMVTVENGKFCVDKYEWPNKKGETPSVKITYSEAQKKCAESGKRLCTPQEWETACQSGKKRNDYPYGSKYKPENCNTMGNPSVKNSLTVSGNFTSCVGDFQIYDMSGNVAEWVESPKKANPYVYGGSWQNSEEGSKCNSRIELEDGIKYFYAGFRCCK